MSWLEKVQSDLVITTGDGKEYRPLWKPKSKSIDFNIAEFTFPEVSGTYVKRSKPKGRKIELEFYFQGEDYIEVSDAFETSSKDERFWVVLHPIYGTISAQIASINFDNSEFNIVTINCTLLETITDDNPKTVTDPIATIKLEKELLDATIVDAFDETPSPADVNKAAANNNKFYTLGKKLTSIAEESQNYFDLFNKANAAILNATALPLVALAAVQAAINAPALFTASVKSRIALIGNQFNLLRGNLGFINTRSGKKMYEATGASLISAQATAASTPVEGDYGNMNSVLEIIEPLIENYNVYLEDLDSLQSDNGGDVDSYIPDADSLNALTSLINFTVSNLLKIALNSKKERSVILDADSNWIELTHRFYGLDARDKNIEELMNNNDAGLNEILHVRKGRKIIYYI